jgi:hypothetical protein
MFFLGNGFEPNRKRNANHLCALKYSKRCALCEIGFNDDKNGDVKQKLLKSLDLFEGISNCNLLKSNELFFKIHFQRPKKRALSLLKMRALYASKN